MKLRNSGTKQIIFEFSVKKARRLALKNLECKVLIYYTTELLQY